MLSVLAWLVGVMVAFRLLRASLHRLLVRVGLCRYHSVLLYTTGVGRRREMHLGTTADFLALDNPGRRLLLARPAEGLLALCDDVEGGRLAPDVHLTGGGVAQGEIELAPDTACRASSPPAQGWWGSSPRPR